MKEMMVIHVDKAWQKLKYKLLFSQWYMLLRKWILSSSNRNQTSMISCILARRSTTELQETAYD